MTNELPYQTYTRLTGQQWHPSVEPTLYKTYGIKDPIGSSAGNLNLQKALLADPKYSATGKTTSSNANPFNVPNSSPNKISGSASVVQSGNMNKAVSSAIDQIGTQFGSTPVAPVIAPTTTPQPDAITTYTQTQAQTQKDDINKQYDAAIAQAKMTSGLVPGAKSGFDAYINGLETKRQQALQAVDQSTEATMETNEINSEKTQLTAQQDAQKNFATMFSTFGSDPAKMGPDELASWIQRGADAGFTPQATFEMMQSGTLKAKAQDAAQEYQQYEMSRGNALLALDIEKTDQALKVANPYSQYTDQNYKLNKGADPSVLPGYQSVPGGKGVIDMSSLDAGAKIQAMNVAKANGLGYVDSSQDTNFTKANTLLQNWTDLGNQGGFTDDTKMSDILGSVTGKQVLMGLVGTTKAADLEKQFSGTGVNIPNVKNLTYGQVKNLISNTVNGMAHLPSGSGGSDTNSKGSTHVYNGVTYTLTNGTWVPQQ